MGASGYKWVDRLRQVDFFFFSFFLFSAFYLNRSYEKSEGGKYHWCRGGFGSALVKKEIVKKKSSRKKKKGTCNGLKSEGNCDRKGKRREIHTYMRQYHDGRTGAVLACALAESGFRQVFGWNEPEMRRFDGIQGGRVLLVRVKDKSTREGDGTK